MPDGRAVMYGSDGHFVPEASWIVNADGTGLRTVPDSEYMEVAPNGRKLAAYGYGGVKVFRPNGNIIGSHSVNGDSDWLSWAAYNSALALIDYDYESELRTLMVADGLAQNTVQLTTGSGFITYDWSPDSSTIVWSDESAISLTDQDGSNTVLLWHNSTGSLNWSPNGSRIAWIDETAIMVANADGSNINSIASNARQFKWSPDSRRIAWYDGEDLKLTRIADSTSVRLPRATVANTVWALSFHRMALVWRGKRITRSGCQKATEPMLFVA